MSAKVVLENIKQNAALAENTITELKKELDLLTSQYNNIKMRQLKEENHKLTLAVEAAKSQLIQLEVKNGIKQIPITQAKCKEVNLNNQTTLNSLTATVETAAAAKIKEKKPKEAKQKLPVPAEPDVDVGRLDLRIGKIADVQKHPDADSLYLLQVDCGENKLRTVCSGLVKFVPMDELKNRIVVLLCNLKPVKMRGITSEAMVMCASSPDNVEVLIPPVDCQPGEPVLCQGYTRNPDPIMNPKKKIFETVAPDLSTNELLEVCYKGTPLNIENKGNIKAHSLKNCPVK